MERLEIWGNDYSGDGRRGFPVHVSTVCDFVDNKI